MSIDASVRDLPSLSREEIFRYGWHLVIPELGLAGQRRLKAARVLMVGAGGLGRLAPLSNHAETLSSMDPGRAVVGYCKMGGRSARTTRRLQAAGFTRVWSLAGGIARWREESDPTIPQY